MSLLKRSTRELSAEILSLSKLLWDYHHMDHTLLKSDVILALGSHDLRVAERAAQLYLEGWAPLLVCSGGLGNLTSEIWTESEADQFAAIAIKMGVPENAVLVENKSTNTGENILLRKSCWKKRDLTRPHLL
jgi:uncharacterized SAM-binding protein YcdF (DUF218 family)